MAHSRVISISVILSLLFILIISHHTTAQPSYLYNFCVYEKGNYTANSAYHRNLNTLLSNLSSNTEIDYGFYNFSQGQGSDRVNAIAMCRGDVKPENCRNCLNVARVKLTELCPNQKEAIVWYDICMLRYSNRTIFNTKETSQVFYMWNVNNATNADQFNQVLSNLMEKLRTTAKAGDSRRKYAADSAKGPSFQNIYGLVQCTPDLSSLECDQCLADSISQIPQCCNNKIGGRVVGPSCNIRFESGPFFETTADELPSPPPSPSPSPSPSTSPSTNNNTSSSQGKSKSNTSRIAVAVAVPVVVVVLVLCFICVYLRVRKRRREITETKEGVDESEEIIANESFQFDFDTIRVATSDFSDSNKLGQGGFGAVYKGKLSNGQMIAVKRLSCNSSQGAMEFKNEVLLLAKLQHRNLVRLLGFCLEGSERLLVYEYVPNKSLDYFIFDQIKKGQLNWMMRYKIIEGVARALLYLHEDSRLRIIHRDLKASNILLDEGMNPKISDFGLAKLFVMDQTQGNTSRIAGTYGYMAPEYAMYGNFSVKSDVFSFGVLVLEIVSGQKHIGIRNGENAEDLLSFSWKNWKEGTATKIIDPSLNNYSLNEMMRCIHIGLLCVQENVTDRPNMTSIVLMLNSYSLTLPVPSEPAFFRDSRAVGLLLPDIQSGDYNSRETTRASESTSKSAQVSENEASITELYPR